MDITGRGPLLRALLRRLFVMDFVWLLWVLCALVLLVSILASAAVVIS